MTTVKSKRTSKPVRKPSKKGILDLADMLVHNMKKYNQNTYGDESSCGTVGCLAGFCLAEKIGARAYNKQAKNFVVDSDACILAGKEKLKLKGPEYPQIFDSVGSWPDDLYGEYARAESDKGRVIVALKALSRLRVDGRIGKKVLTNIPQLKQLQ